MRNRSKYAKNFRKRAAALKQQVGNCCQECGVCQWTIQRSKWTGNYWPVFLQAAHPDHDPENPEARLVIVCPGCHS